MSRRILAVVAALGFGGSCVLGQAALNLQDVVLALSFDEGEGVVAHDGTENMNMNDGALVMEADWRPGKIGSSVRLKDQAHVEIQPSESLNLGGTDFSMALWISFSEKTGWTTLMTHNDGANLVLYHISP